MTRSNPGMVGSGKTMSGRNWNGKSVSRLPLIEVDKVTPSTSKHQNIPGIAHYKTTVPCSRIRAIVRAPAIIREYAIPIET